jgi:hypothetical protein
MISSSQRGPQSARAAAKAQLSESGGVRPDLRGSSSATAAAGRQPQREPRLAERAGFAASYRRRIEQHAARAQVPTRVQLQRQVA